MGLISECDRNLSFASRGLRTRTLPKMRGTRYFYTSYISWLSILFKNIYTFFLEGVTQQDGTTSGQRCPCTQWPPSPPSSICPLRPQLRRRKTWVSCSSLISTASSFQLNPDHFIPISSRLLQVVQKSDQFISRAMPQRNYLVFEAKNFFLKRKNINLNDSSASTNFF